MQSHLSALPQNQSQFAIRSRNVVLEDHLEPVDAIILVQNQKIIDIILPNEIETTQLDLIYQKWEVRDYENFHILPGIIDSNVYLHADFGVEWENVIYSTELAAAGGVTTIIDNPVMTKSFNSGWEYVESLQQRISTIRENSKVDFGIYGILDPNTESHIDGILEAGALGLKCFMISPFQNTIGHYPPECFKNLIEDLTKAHPNLLILVHPEVATERELYLSSPCRTVSFDTRLDKHHAIKSIEFGGAANKGSFVDDFARKNGESDEEDLDDCPTAKIDTPSKLRGKIKKIKEMLEIRDLALSELASYSFENQVGYNTDDSNSDSEIESFKRPIIRSHTCPSTSQPSESYLPNQGREAGQKLTENKPLVIHVSPFKKSLFAHMENSKLEEIKTNQIQLQIREDYKESERMRQKGSLDILAGIPEEFDKEESRDTLRQIKSDNQSQDQEKSVFSRDDFYEESKRELMSEVSLDLTDRIHAKSHIIEEKSVSEQKLTPTPNKKIGRQRFMGWDEDELQQNNQKEARQVPQRNDSPQLNLISTQKTVPTGSQSSFKEERASTLDSFDACMRSGIRDFSTEGTCDKDEHSGSGSKRTGNNRKFLSLMTDSDAKDTEAAESFSRHRSTLASESIPEDRDSKFTDDNLSPWRSPLNTEASPDRFESESPNMMSPVNSRSPPANSSLLLRRISRKSSCNVACGSNSSILSSPTVHFHKVNLLNLSSTAKGSPSKEAKYNQNYRVFLANRPQSWEENAVSIILSAVKPETKIRMVLQNLSLASSFFKVRQKQKSSEGMREKVISDTCPSYLFFTEKMVKKGETKYKVSPPFRSRDNRQILIETLRLGGVDMMSSYHFFVPPRFKAVDDGNFRRAFGGLDSIGCSLQAAWTSSYNYQMKNNRKFSEDPLYQKMVVNNIIRKIYKAMCYNPAEVLRIDNRKGAIAKGRDADFVIWDPYSIENNNQLGPNHVFSGRQLLGTVHKTYLRGNLIFDKDRSEKVATNYPAEFIRP